MKKVTAIIDVKFLTIVLLSASFQGNFAKNEADIYEYTAKVTTEDYEPLLYESSSKINAKLLVQSESCDGTSKAYIMAFKNIKVSKYTGRSKDKDPDKVFLDRRNVDFEKPFYVIYREDGQFQSITFVKDDPVWSQNIKLSIASAIQMNLKIEAENETHFSYFANEHTIHGICRVSNNVVRKHDEEMLKITKNYIPKDCNGYPSDEFNTKRDQFIRLQDNKISSVNKIIEVSAKGNSMKIVKYEGNEIETFMPFLHKSDGLVTRSRQRLILSEESVECQEYSKSLFHDGKIKHLMYKRPTTLVAKGARHDIECQDLENYNYESDTFSLKIVKMLRESYKYLNSNRFIKRNLNLFGGDNINNIFEAIIFFNYKLMMEVWNELISEENTEEAAFMKKTFLDIISHIGTEASATVIRDIVLSGTISNAAATDVLSQFPQYILEPKEQILDDMKVFLNLGERTSNDVKKSAILSFGSLLNRVYSNVSSDIPDKLEHYLQYFNNQLIAAIEDNDNEMILVYVMVFQNIKVGKIERFLWPILRKDIKIKEDSDRIRTAIAYAIFAGVAGDQELIHDIYFPILVNDNEYLSLRIISFLRLAYVSQMENQKRPMELYWHYIKQCDDPVLENLHSSMIASFSNFGYERRQNIRETYEKILKFIEPISVNYSMPSLKFIDFPYPKYGYGEVMIEYIIKTIESTGLHDIGAFFYNIAYGRKPEPFVQYYWMYQGIDEILLDGLQYFLKDCDDCQELLNKYQSEVPTETNATFVLIPYYGYQVGQIHYYKKKSLKKETNTFWEHLSDKINHPVTFYSEYVEATYGTEAGVPNIIRHLEPNLVSYKVVNLNDAKAKDTTLHLNLKVTVDIWSHGSCEISIFNAIADIFHTARRHTSVDATIPFELDISYDLESRILKIFAPKLSSPKDSSGKLITYSKVFVASHEGKDSDKCYPNCFEKRAVTRGKQAKKTYNSQFKSHKTSAKYDMNIFDCETGFNSDIDKMDWLEAIYNPARNNLLGPFFEEYLVAKQKFVVDMMSPRPGICGILREYIPSTNHSSAHLKYDLSSN